MLIKGGRLVDPLQDITVVDYGTAPNDMLSTERTIHAVRSFVRQAAGVQHEDGRHVIPFIVGGDHSLSYPNLAAMADVYGKGNVGVIHFDAHYDGTLYMGHLINHGGWVKRLIKEGHVPGKNYIQVALRGYYPDEEAFEWMREQGFRYHTMAEVERRGWDAVMEDVIREARDGPDYLFISFDIDAIDRELADLHKKRRRRLAALFRRRLADLFPSTIDGEHLAGHPRMLFITASDCIRLKLKRPKLYQNQEA